MPNFFSTPAVKKDAFQPMQATVKELLKAEYIDVGSNGYDCGFRAIAAAIVSKCLAQRSRANQDLLSRLFLEHFKNYQDESRESKRGKELLTPIDRLEKITRESMADFIRDFSSTLRKMALAEIRRDPVAYQGAYVNADKERTSLEAMALATTEIDETVIAAIANATGVAINVRVVEADKELPKRLCYNKAAIQTTGAAVNIQLQLPQKHYIPAVYQPARFEKLYESAPTVEPFIAVEGSELSQIIRQIEAENKALAEQYEDYTTKILYKIIDGEMTKSDLINIYIKGLNSSDYLCGRVKQVGLENGNQDFFEKLLNHAKKDGPIKAIVLSDKSYDEQLLTELVHAIARAMTIGDLDPDWVFNDELTQAAYEEPRFTGLGR